MGAILIDSRVGSHDLVKPLQATGLPVEEVVLPFADVAFQGKGPNGTILDIGIELKRLGDLVVSLRSGRLAGHQLPGLREAFDYYWLVVEGYWHVNLKGQLVEKHQRGWHPLLGNMSASEMEKQVLTLELCGGFHVRFTNTRADTLHFIRSLYRWWSDKSLEKHQSHLMVHTPPTLVPVSDERAFYMRLPGVGLKASLAVERHFASPRRALTAGIADWAAIETASDGKTRRLGTAVASNIEKFLSRKT